MRRLGAPPRARLAAARRCSRSSRCSLLAAAVAALTFGAAGRGRHVALRGACRSARALANALESYVALCRAGALAERARRALPARRSAPPGPGVAAARCCSRSCGWWLRAARARPYFAVGWLWFLGTLVPVIGLVQVGAQARADRYMYLPLIGLSIVVAWGACDLLEPPARAARWRGAVPRAAPRRARVVHVAARSITGATPSRCSSTRSR